MPCVVGGGWESNVPGAACTVQGEEAYKLTVVYKHTYHSHSCAPALAHPAQSAGHYEEVRTPSRDTKTLGLWTGECRDSPWHLLGTD